MKTRITDRQREIYEFIQTTIAGRGIPPTIREIGEAFGIRSTNGVEKHLQALEQSGFVMRERGKSRSISLHVDGKRPLATVPLLGRVAAGVPVLSHENHEGEFAVDISLFSLRSPHNLFALKVKGESMIDAHIVDGDTVIVRVQSAAQSGDIVVALVNGEATVKRLFVERDHVRLQPENSSMKPLNLDRGDFRVLGRVVGVVRKI